MPKRVFIIHGWSGTPEEGWFPQLKKALEKKGFVVEVPSMPNSDYPKINKWVSFLAKIVKKPDKNTFFVGHSIGCQTILRYIETIKGKNEKVGGVIFVAGWFTLKNLETEEEKKIARPWIETKINFNEIKKKTNKFVAIFSDNDPYVPLENISIFREKLGAKIIIEKNKGHCGNDDTKILLSVFKELLVMIKKSND